MTPKRDQVWQNIKKGTFYYVLYIATEATNSREGTQSVVYISHDGQDKNVYVRELEEFMHKFEYWGKKEKI